FARHGRAAVLKTKTSLDRAALVGEWWLAMRAAILLTVLIATASAATEPPATCGFGAGALPVDTLPPGTPHGAAIPLDHILVLMQETHSSAPSLGHLQAEAPPHAGAEPRHAVNPDPTVPAGAPRPARDRIRAFHDRHTCVPDGLDLDHSWTGSHREWDGGAM